MDEPIRKPKKLKLYKALRIAGLRGNPKRQAKMLKKFGYILDKDLDYDRRETLIAYSPSKNQVLFVANSTDPKNERDLLTDLAIAGGKLRTSARFMDTKELLNKAHDKYKDAKFKLAGYSLGGSLVNAAAPRTDEVITYNAGFSPGQKARENVQNYRTESDIISVFAPKENTTILKARKQTNKEPLPQDSTIKNVLRQGATVATKEILTPYLGAVGGTLASGVLIAGAEKLINQSSNFLKPHRLQNIQGAPIFL